MHLLINRLPPGWELPPKAVQLFIPNGQQTSTSINSCLSKASEQLLLQILQVVFLHMDDNSPIMCVSHFCVFPSSREQWTWLPGGMVGCIFPPFQNKKFVAICWNMVPYLVLDLLMDTTYSWQLCENTSGTKIVVLVLMSYGVPKKTEADREKTFFCEAPIYLLRCTALGRRNS
jgi:hypothetical protein